MGNRFSVWRSPAVLLLWADGTFAAVLAAACFALGTELAGWFDVPRAAAWIAGGVLAAASVTLGACAARRALGVLPLLGVVHAVAGGLLWTAAPIAWSGFTAEGRWIASALANANLLIALTAWLAWRREQPG